MLNLSCKIFQIIKIDHKRFYRFRPEIVFDFYFNSYLFVDMGYHLIKTSKKQQQTKQQTPNHIKFYLMIVQGWKY